VSIPSTSDAKNSADRFFSATLGFDFPKLAGLSNEDISVDEMEIFLYASDQVQEIRPDRVVRNGEPLGTVYRCTDCGRLT